MPCADRRSDSVDPRAILLRGHNLGGCPELLQSVQKGLGSIVFLEISNVGPDPRGSYTVAGTELRIDPEKANPGGSSTAIIRQMTCRTRSVNRSSFALTGD